MKKLFVLFMLMLVVFAGCNSSTGNDKDNDGNGNGNGDGTYTVSGSVRLNSASGAGVSGVTVVLAQISQTPNPLTATTGSDGAYSFSNIAPGSYMISVDRDNYTFVPEYVSFAVVDKNVVVQTFVGTTVNTGGNSGSHTLFPLKTGAEWTYDSVVSLGVINIDESEVNNVTGTMNMGGKSYWALQANRYDSDGEEDSNETFYLRIENNVLYAYGTDFITSKPVPHAAKAASVFKSLQSHSDLALIKFNVSPGSTWDIYRDASTTPGAAYSLIITGTYVGTETVESYTNCSKYELVYTSETNSSFGAIASRWEQTIWFAPNIGIVKTVEVFSYGDTLENIAELSSTTNILDSYQIP